MLHALLKNCIRSPLMSPAEWNRIPARRTTKKCAVSSRLSNVQTWRGSTSRGRPVRFSWRSKNGAFMKGHFGKYGGQFVPETLMHPLEELEAAYDSASRD